MIIDCIADLHGFYPTLEGGDLLIIAGDCTRNDRISGWNQFFEWLDRQEYTRKIMIAGNHDNFCTSWARSDDSIYEALVERPSVTYLCDSGTEFEYIQPVRNLFDKDDKSLVFKRKLKIWGSPWTKTFAAMNPHCMAFTVDTEEELAKKWELIPEDIDILITHSPPYGILDKTIDGREMGSSSLQNRLCSSNRKLLSLHVFGHIHESYGISNLGKRINASHVNERYQPVNKPIRIEL